jgi:hypothetical protein
MEIPDNNVDFVQFVKDVHQYACELGDERSHVLAHCLSVFNRSIKINSFVKIIHYLAKTFKSILQKNKFTQIIGKRKSNAVILMSKNSLINYKV